MAAILFRDSRGCDICNHKVSLEPTSPALLHAVGITVAIVILMFSGVKIIPSNVLVLKYSTDN